jgi:eukaryotic-like serine/threonine-protein kinase
VSLQPGTRLGPYEIRSALGHGGMGEVFRALDTRLGRLVAIKISQEEFSGRFEREARSIAALNHPHICTLYDVGPNFLVMELLEGETLANALRKGPPSEEDALTAAIEIAGALVAAHEHGIVHRDLKPGNVMLTASGVKVLDFGLAKQAPNVDAETMAGSAPDPRTAVGEMLGTVPYMSPEQVAGKPVDGRSDIFAFGVMYYEMLCGRRPFDAETDLATLASILHTAPAPPSSYRNTIPKSVDRIVLRCLEKNPEARYGSASELHRDLVALRPATARARNSTRVALIAVALTLAIGAAAFGIRAYLRTSRVRWVTNTAIPEITRLINANRRLAALELFRQAQSYDPGSPVLYALGEGVVVAPQVAFETSPPGAQIYISDYLAEAGDDLTKWRLLGETPLESKDIPVWGYYHVRAIKDGFAPADVTYFALGHPPVQLTLHTETETPPGMTWVAEGATTTPAAPAMSLPGFWIDKYEVSNRQFKMFVDGGGYEHEKYWANLFPAEESWKTAVEKFRDLTGRPGPAGWQLGAYPEGAADLPVAGVSWYEANAYANFVAKALPTAYEWFAAAGIGASGTSDILTLSNFGTRGPAPVGTHRAMARFGSYDMAGNLKEWVANPVDDRRYILGGAWDEEPYMFNRVDAKSPASRGATNGFRLVQRVMPVPQETAEPLVWRQLERRLSRVLSPGASERGQPVDDRTYQVFERLHAYDKTELEARIESTTELPYGRRETISFRTAYGSERMLAHLFLPNSARPPYQTVAFFGHSGVLSTRRIEDLQLPYEFIVRSGRALIIPVYSGTLERGPSNNLLPPSQQRERGLKWSMDLGRSLDYLETRSDIDIARLGFYGVSLGAVIGPRLIAVEPRIKVAVLASGGIYDGDPPEVNAWNFAPHVHVPVLMVNGRDDFISPVETDQKPLFAAFGTKEPDKVFRQYDGGHANLLTRPALIGEILNWLDKYLGPVTHQP